MTFVSVLKRVLPFVATFAAGLFLASFFVDLSPPSMESRGHRRGRCREHQGLRMQYLRERERNEQLQQQLDALQQNPIDLKHTEHWNVPELDVPPPPPPPVARAPRTAR